VSLSVEDFNKTLSYVLLYSSIHKVDIVDMTLSVVLTKEPVRVFSYIRDRLGYEVRERESGIYEVRGFPFPVQIIENKKLSRERHRFLSIFNEGLDKETVAFILNEAKKPHQIDISAFVDVILRANPRGLKEVLMENLTLEEVLEEVGLAARWEARGEARGDARGEARGEARTKIQVAHKLIQKGWDSAEIAEATELDIETVESLMGRVHA
jgi:predicted transposase/invertase (TIGR01784 family)